MVGLYRLTVQIVLVFRDVLKGYVIVVVMLVVMVVVTVVSYSRLLSGEWS